MANGLKGEVPLNLNDGRHLTLVFDVEGLISSETIYGKPMHELVSDAGKGFMGATRALLFGALRAHHPEITLPMVSQMLADNPTSIMEALSNAHDASMPKASSASTEGKAVTAPRLRGKNSGASGVKRSSSRKRSGG